MITLTVTAKGQLTLRKDILEHLGIGPGEEIQLELLPDGRGILQAPASAKPTGTIADFIGLLASQTTRVATIDEINEAIALGWAGKQ